MSVYGVKLELSPEDNCFNEGNIRSDSYYKSVFTMYYGL